MPFMSRFLALAFLCSEAAWSSSSLPTSDDAYREQAAVVRQSIDRPWQPEAGRLGNLRHVQITARDCVVRIVSGNENRVFPGTRGVIVVEQSRVLDDDPDARPVPRDVVLSTDVGQACPGPGSCGVSMTHATQAPTASATGEVCFTVQIASAHELLLGGDGLSLLVERVRQPVLNVSLNPFERLHVWFEQVDIGLLSISANAPARIGGRGRVDFLQLGSSNSGSRMLLHGFDARHIGVTATTTDTDWSIRIGPETHAVYYQPARAGGRIAKLYPIEIDGPLERLEVPAGSVDPRPLSAAMRAEATALRERVLASAGPPPVLPAPDPALPTAVAAVAALPRSARQRVADVVARYLPASVRITDIDLWKSGGRLEGIAPDAATASAVLPRLRQSGEFVHVAGGGPSAVDGGHAFSLQMHFSCEAPGQPSVCPAGEAFGRYTEEQVRKTVAALLGPGVTLLELRREGDGVELRGEAANEADAVAALGRIRPDNGLVRTSVSGYGPSSEGSPTPFRATLDFICPAPPKPNGICALGALAPKSAPTR